MRAFCSSRRSTSYLLGVEVYKKSIARIAAKLHLREGGVLGDEVSPFALHRQVDGRVTFPGLTETRMPVLTESGTRLLRSLCYVAVCCFVSNILTRECLMTRVVLRLVNS